MALGCRPIEKNIETDLEDLLDGISNKTDDKFERTGNKSIF